ncbi:antitoxin, Phd family protein [Serratia sp. S1B]|nr:antitoxin, Phd family protein [Serratia sp. S1B]
MRFSEQIRSISYLKTHAAEVLKVLSDSGAPMIITQNGEAKAVLQDVVAYEQTQESLALLKVLALGQQQVEAGAVTPVESVVQRLKGKRG